MKRHWKKQKNESVNYILFENVERSYRPDIEMNFAEKIGNKTVLKDEGFEIEELNTEIRLAEHL